MPDFEIKLDIDKFEQHILTDRIKHDYDENTKRMKQIKTGRKYMSVFFLTFILLAVLTFLSVDSTVRILLAIATSFIGLALLSILYVITHEDHLTFDGYQMNHALSKCGLPDFDIYELYWLLHTNNQYIRLLHNLLTDSSYKLVDISFEIQNDTYVLEIYYSIDNKIKIYRCAKSLTSAIVTDTDKITLDLCPISITDNCPQLYIPYIDYRTNTIRHKVQYYFDISKLTNTINEYKQTNTIEKITFK